MAKDHEQEEDLAPAEQIQTQIYQQVTEGLLALGILAAAEGLLDLDEAVAAGLVFFATAVMMTNPHPKEKNLLTSRRRLHDSKLP